MKYKLSNVLLIMTDQQRFDTIAALGNDEIETPTLDWLSRKGIVFNKAYTPSPSCVPARTSLITGKKPWNHGILGMGSNQKEMGVNFKNTLPKSLSEAGYHTQGIGKMHFFPQRSLNGFHNTILDESGRKKDDTFISDYIEWFERNKPSEVGIVDHGLDWNGWGGRPYHLPEYLHPTNWTVNESIKFLNKRDPSKPFFLKMSFARPHSPYDPPEFYFNKYINKQLSSPTIGEWVKEIEQPNVPLDAWNTKISKEDEKLSKAGYYGSITHIDYQLRRFILELKKRELLDDTLIIFTSDHGDMMGDHNLYRKTYAYEGSSHIPMIIKLPKKIENKIKYNKIEEPVLIQDIYPTILDILGLEIPKEIDGKSMFKLIKGEDIKREYIHGEHSTCYSKEFENHYIVYKNYKYIYYPRRTKHLEQLFDLENDPYETLDLSNDIKFKEILEKTRNFLIKEISERGDEVVHNETLKSLINKDFIESPNYNKRLKESGWDWSEFGKFKKGSL
jgi:arylsulfatase A-like enzyme